MAARAGPGRTPVSAKYTGAAGATASSWRRVGATVVVQVSDVASR